MPMGKPILIALGPMGAAIVTNLVLKPHAEACCFGLSYNIVAKASLCWEIEATPDSCHCHGDIAITLMILPCVLTQVGRSGRLSESRGDCQRVGKTVRESGTVSEKRRRRHGGDDVVMEAATSSHHHDDVAASLTMCVCVIVCVLWCGWVRVAVGVSVVSSFL